MQPFAFVFVSWLKVAGFVEAAGVDWAVVVVHDDVAPCSLTFGSVAPAAPGMQTNSLHLRHLWCEWQCQWALC